MRGPASRLEASGIGASCIALAVVLPLAIFIVACGDDETGAGGSDAGSSGTSVGDTSSTSQSSAAATSTSSGAGDIPDFNGCTEDAYVDGTADDFDRTIGVGTAGLVFDPKCLVVAAGQSVTFAGSFNAHPIAPGNAADGGAGSADSPITETTSGTTVTFTFDAPGTYPYYCMLHGFGDGQGMSGVVHVR